MKEKKWVRTGFYLAGGVNIIGILVFSKFFTNDLMQSIDPEVCSNVGIVSIILWGMAYISVMNCIEDAPLIVGVFLIEKFYYAIVWRGWISENFSDLGGIYEQDLITGVFYSVYGLNDLLFGVFFSIVFIKCIGRGRRQ